MRLSGQDSSEQPRPVTPANRRLERLILLAASSIAFERLWRGLVYPLCVIGLFLCLSWAGLWLEVTRPMRIVLVALLGLLFLASLLRFARLALPSRREALERIDQASGFPHRPASVLDDRLANAPEDPITRALWELHKRRATRFLGALRSGRPSPRVAETDRWALRALVLVALVACGFLAGPEKYARIAAAFDWRGTGISGPGYRLDAWIDPPPYTGKAPLLLNLAAPEARQADKRQMIEAPVNSQIIVRSFGGETGIDMHGGLADAQPVDDKSANGATKAAAPGEGERHLLLSGDADLALHHAGTLLGNFEIHAIADRAPTIALTEVPKQNARGSLSLAYRLADDYGVTSAEANFAHPRTPDGTPFEGRALIPPPHVDLSLAPGTGGLGDAEMTADLSDHPWAGLRVTMTLSAKDEGGNEGKSEPAEIILPRKPFVNPLARAVAEQRRDILLRPDDRTGVETALNALMIAPDAFDMKDSIYLGLRVAVERLAQAKSDADLVALADYLWDMAQRIENGDLTDAERAMRDAEKQLREALQRNASPEEIRKLTENLRAAMDKFVQELAKQGQEQGDRQNADRGQKPGKSVSQKELQSMLDRMQEMARSGNMADAQKALDQLQNILENLKSANRQNNDPRNRAANRALEDLDHLSKEQQDLRDETYRQSQGDQSQEPSQQQQRRGQQQRRQQQNGAQAGRRNQQGQQQNQGGSPEDQDDEASNQGQGKSPGQGQDDETLQQRQQALRQSLEQLQRRLKQMGQSDQGFDDAQNAMEEAEKSLGQGDQGQEDAVDAQGRALDSLRKGTQKLAEQLKQQQGEGQGEGEGEDGEEGAQQSDNGGGNDPAGRARGQNPEHHNLGEMGTPAVQRAQKVLEELRRRLSDPNRPHEEMDYLERLLRRY